MIERISRPWHITRLLQFLLGLGLLGSYFMYNPDNFTLAIGGVLLFQAIMDVGCPLGGACATPAGRQRATEAADLEDELVTYEEVKP